MLKAAKTSVNYQVCMLIPSFLSRRFENLHVYRKIGGFCLYLGDYTRMWMTWHIYDMQT